MGPENSSQINAKNSPENNEEFFVEGDGTETRSFCFIDDAISATLLAHNDDSHKERIFNIGTNFETSILNLI